MSTFPKTLDKLLDSHDETLKALATADKKKTAELKAHFADLDDMLDRLAGKRGQKGDVVADSLAAIAKKNPERAERLSKLVGSSKKSNVEKANPHHLPPGPGGGQFTTGPSSGGAGSGISSAARKSQLERYRVFSEDTKPKDQDFVVASQEKITDTEEIEVLNEYAVDGFKTINPAARGDESATPEAIEQVQILESALNKTEAPVDMVVHRGVDMSHWGVNPENVPDVDDRQAYAQFMVDHIDNNLTGTRYMDDSFLSTSMSQDVALEFAGHKSTGAMVEVRVPQGTKGASIVHQLEGASTFADEREFLLQRGLRYEIVDSRRDFVGPNFDLVPIMIVEVVPEGE